MRCMWMELICCLILPGMLECKFLNKLSDNNYHWITPRMLISQMQDKIFHTLLGILSSLNPAWLQPSLTSNTKKLLNK